MQVKAAVFLTSLLCVSAFAEDPKVTSLIMQGDAEEREHHTRAALSTFRSAEKIEPNNLGVLLRISKQYSDLIADTKPDAVAQSLAQKALDYALRAIEIDPLWVQGRKRVGITAGASAPEVLVRGVIERLRELGAAHVAELSGEPEDMVFALPKELRVQLVD